MGNAIQSLRGRSEEETAAILKEVVTKYEEIRSRSQLSFLAGKSTSEAGSNARISELQLYKELERELSRVLGLPMPPSPPSPSNTSSSASSSPAVAGGDRRTTGNVQIGSTSRLEFAGEYNPSVTRVSASSKAGTSGSTRTSAGAGAGAAVASAGSAPGVGNKPISIMVVDDSPISCKLAKRALAPFNFHVEIALDGRKGLDILYSRPHEFDLVVLDIVMPGLDGIEVLRCMKSHPLLSSIAVAMLSGLQDEMLEEVCFQQGAVVVLKKPMKIEDVLRVVQTHCRPNPASATAGVEEGVNLAPVAALMAATTLSGVERPKSPAKVAGNVGSMRREAGSLCRRRFLKAQEVPNFELLNERQQAFNLHETLARWPDQKLLLAFFPAAFTESAFGAESVGCSPVTSPRRASSVKGSSSSSGRSEGVLSTLMANLGAIRATNTFVVGIGKDLPYTLSALSSEKSLEFPILSDAFLDVSEEFVGTFDLGMYFPSVFGRLLPSVTDHRGANAGVVVLNGRRKCLYRWLSVDGNGDPIFPASIDLSELMTVLRTVPRKEAVDSMSALRADRSVSEDDRRTSGVSGMPSIPPNDSRRSPVGETGTGTRKVITILIVDDSTISCKLAIRKLKTLGYATLHAENGQSALEILRRRSNQVDLVLLDIVMPIMDGVEFLNIVKNDPSLQHTPVVMLSSLDREQLGQACMEAGALAVLQKPLKPNEVQDLIVREGIH